MRIEVRRAVGSIVLLALAAGPLAAQGLVDRVQRIGDGRVHLSFAARPGVCGGHNQITVSDRDDEWEGSCPGGPVYVSMRLRAGRVIEAHTYVGGHWKLADRAVIDLGVLPAAQAGPGLLLLVERAEGDAEELITAAALADSAVVWPALLRLARSPALPLETRRHAIFWLGQAAGDAAIRGLDSVATDASNDLEVRKQAIFALSQRPADEGVPALIRIARTSPHPQLRRTALFWLSQSEDPRALSLFEEILR